MLARAGRSFTTGYVEMCLQVKQSSALALMVRSSLWYKTSGELYSRCFNMGKHGLEERERTWVGKDLVQESGVVGKLGYGAGLSLGLGGMGCSCIGVMTTSRVGFWGNRSDV